MKINLLTSIRTNNFNDDQMMEKIQSMWKEAYQSLEGKSDTVYGVYFDYASDFKGDYSIGVGIEDAEYGRIVIPDQSNYKVFKVASLEEEGILKTWQKIWRLEESGELERGYTVDFEKYLPSGEIEIHIALK
ncbi:GyrI-like domain-containing protein [Gracilibacillus thailandensis]|uniref:AraC family transcriptional regulator n=1 Tax=Gracilibacillus thailandensis TaxID=563735 RepID=A0A6N7QWP5_9BACI|nr:effector binding domain-containing protein [Gracilibacillus thailandensis]MRI66537.1 AraC family transcriptional regulator [Gracilibacillus thailandensis]